MFSKPIEIWDVIIPSISHKNRDGTVMTRISVTGTLNPALAKELGIEDLIFHKNGTPKGGFSSLALDTGCAAFRATIEAEQLKQQFELVSGDSTDSYVVQRMDEGVMQLRLRLNYHGDPHLPVAFVKAVGNAEAILRITPLQSEIDPNPVKTNAEYAAEEEAEEQQRLDVLGDGSSGREAVRQRLIGRGHGRKQATARS